MEKHIRDTRRDSRTVLSGRTAQVSYNGEVLNKHEITFQLERVVWEHYGREYQAKHTDMWYEVEKQDSNGDKYIDIELHTGENLRCLCGFKNDLLNYYRPNGSKVTKYIRNNILKNYLGMDNQTIDKHYANFCNDVSKLYADNMLIDTWFIPDFHNLGDGYYEGGHSTCFRDGGENENNKNYLASSSRYQAIAVRMKGRDGREDSMGRALVYFAGGRNVFIFNHYHGYGLPQTKELFTDALRALLGWKDAQVGRDDMGDTLFYLNGDAVHLWDNKGGHEKRYYAPSRKHRMTCPVCGRKRRESDMDVYVDGCTRIIGCSEECTSYEEDNRYTCVACGDRMDEDDIYIGGDDVLCEDCYHSNYSSCAECGETTYNDDTIETHDGDSVCRVCAREHYYECEKCSEVYHIDNVQSTPDGDSWCHECFSEVYEECAECGEYVERDTMTRDIFRFVCEDCTPEDDDTDNQ